MQTCRILAFGDSNTFGSQPSTIASGPLPRHSRGARWTGILSDSLGASFELVEAGLPGRTTDIDDFGEPAGFGPSLNGRVGLPIVVRSANPVHIVLMMLGTNDLKRVYGRRAEDVADALAGLIDDLAKINQPTAYAAPVPLLIVPPPISEAVTKGRFGNLFDERSVKESRRLPTIVAERSRELIDLGKTVEQMDGVDGLHLTAAAHRNIAATLFGPVSAKRDALARAGHL